MAHLEVSKSHRHDKGLEEGREVEEAGQEAVVEEEAHRDMRDSGRDSHLVGKMTCLPP